MDCSSEMKEIWPPADVSSFVNKCNIWLWLFERRVGFTSIFRRKEDKNLSVGPRLRAAPKTEILSVLKHTDDS